MRKLSKRSTAVIAGVAVVAIGGGAAWAANGWNIGGSGSADAEAATITDLTATSTLAGKIYPGVTTKVNSGVINLNDFPVQLTASSAAVTSFDGTADPTCKSALAANPGIFTTTFPDSPTIPAKATSAVPIESTVTIGDLPQACAGKAIKINYTFQGVSKA
ncbi:hypothetical protein Acy02nite_41230 [Actinoplanes cyaneus]|uniref:Ribosomally synthesized peptide with SipW-like signal peptide n=1 Tax=Actinoplanes cyaneus TaxID=52696 RepID=A0A919IKX3_9ACTN|nr:hypothetical protein [Actinoplanes cyaneus]MCW2138285.1 hypothetical protein [Actinoplanes cyaneus]GID66242.1 hypothetical protein Acy02nite_41230 [Actinoplanes cyaneus]